MVVGGNIKMTIFLLTIDAGLYMLVLLTNYGRIELAAGISEITLVRDALNKLLDVKRALLWRAAEKHGLTPLQIQVLTFIKSCDGVAQVSANDVARELYVTRATMSVAVRALEKKGLVKRRPSGHDKRKQYLTLATKAAALLEDNQRYDNALLSQLMAFPEHSLKAASKVLVGLLASMLDHGLIDHVTMCLKCDHCQKVSMNRLRCSLSGRTFTHDSMRIGCCSYTSTGGNAHEQIRLQ